MYCLVFSTVFAKYLSQMLPQDMCHMYDMYTRVSYTVYSVEKSRENYGAIRHAEFWGHAPLPVTPDSGFWDEGKRSRVSFMRGARGHRVSFMRGTRGHRVSFMRGARGHRVSFTRGARGHRVSFMRGARGRRVSFMRGARGHRVYIYEWGKRAQGLVGEWAKKSQGSNGFFNVRGGTGSQGSI